MTTYKYRNYIYLETLIYTYYNMINVKLWQIDRAVLWHKIQLPFLQASILHTPDPQM